MSKTAQAVNVKTSAELLAKYGQKPRCAIRCVDENGGAFRLVIAKNIFGKDRTAAVEALNKAPAAQYAADTCGIALADDKPIARNAAVLDLTTATADERKVLTNCVIR